MWSGVGTTASSATASLPENSCGLPRGPPSHPIPRSRPPRVCAVSAALPFPERGTPGVTQFAAFSDWLLLFSVTHSGLLCLLSARPRVPFHRWALSRRLDRPACPSPPEGTGWFRALGIMKAARLWAGLCADVSFRFMWRDRGEHGCEIQQCVVKSRRGVPILHPHPRPSVTVSAVWHPLQNAALSVYWRLLLPVGVRRGLVLLPCESP